MKLIILILIISSFLQSTTIAFNLCLVILISQSLVVNSKYNLIIAFSIGLLLSYLLTINIGFYALIFLAVVKLVQLFKFSAFTDNAPASLIITAIFSYLVATAEQYLLNQTLNLNKIIIESVLSLPIYLFIKIWEERFVVKSAIRLKIRD